MDTAGSPTAWVVAFLVGWAILRAVVLINILVVFGLGAGGGHLVGRSAARIAAAAA